MKRVHVFFALVAFAAVTPVSASENRLPALKTEKQPLPLLEIQVRAFRVNSISILDALIELGRQERVPFGIEFVDLVDLRKRISLDLEEVTIGEVVKAILSHGKGYTYSVRDGVVNISHKDVPTEWRRNLLLRVLPEFSVPERTPVETAGGLLLRARLERLVHPPKHEARGPVGIAGSFGVVRFDNQIGPFTLRNVSVRDALNRIVREKQNAAWVVVAHPQFLDRIPESGLWRIIDYDSLPGPWSEFIRASLQKNWPKSHNSK